MSDINAIRRLVRSPGFFYAVDYGAKFDNYVTDDTAAIQATLDAAGQNSVIILPAGRAKITSKLVTYDNQEIRGGGSHRTVIKKFANTDMLELATNGVLRGIQFHGYGELYTGRGILITTGERQTLYDCNVVETEGYCVEYSHLAGRNGGISGGIYSRRDYETNAIKYPAAREDSATNRFIFNVDTTGAWLCDTGGLDNLRITNCRFKNMTFGALAQKVQLVGNRISSVAATLNVDGSHGCVVGNAIAGDIVLAAGTTGNTISANAYVNGATSVTDNSGTNSNYIQQVVTAYTPTWTAVDVNPSLGDGTLTGHYSREGRTITLHIRLVIGSTTDVGTGKWMFALPKPVGINGIGSALVIDSGTAFYSCVAFASGSTVSVYVNGADDAVKQGNPMTWAENDSMQLTVTYEL